MTVVGVGVIAFATLEACSSFSGTSTPEPEAGAPTDAAGNPTDGPADGPSEASPLRCKSPGSPTTIGFYDEEKKRFELFSKNAVEDPALAFNSGTTEMNLQPIAAHATGQGDIVGWYSQATRRLTTLAQNKMNATTKTSAVVGSAGPLWRPFIGDWNKDGASDLGLFDPATRDVLLPEPDAGASFAFGGTVFDARPLAGDWNGDGQDGIGLFLPNEGAIILKQVAAGGAEDLKIQTNHKGLSVWPMAGDWDGCGPVRPGLYDSVSATVYLLRENKDGTAEDVIKLPSSYEGSARRPIAGRWQPPP